ncbi:TIM44-like domain-containing protein [Astrobacterium formosum]|uniref:TIM44-like domain-containing protein n=1 Tax=Astrobacterium formosum TaxID=3069710 RepID=UPI003F4FAA19
MRRSIRALLAVLAVIVSVGWLVAEADARVGGGGSRGSRTFSAPPVTRTAPTQSAPLQRTITQPNQPGSPAASRPAAQQSGSWFNRPGMGLLGGLAAGFLGAGLIGMLFGGGFLSGIGGFASMLGFIIQIALVVIVARLAWGWWQRRNQPATASGPSLYNSAPEPQSYRPTGGAMGSALGGYGAAKAEPSDEIGISGADYDEFERLLSETQAAYSDEDIAKLKALATPEMVSYFSEDLTANASRGVVNKISDVKLLQGDLAEAWHEDNADYATVAMKFALTDRMIERTSQKVVEGGEPEEVTELWTFRRARGGRWIVSAVQEA